MVGKWLYSILSSLPLSDRKLCSFNYVDSCFSISKLREDIKMKTLFLTVNVRKVSKILIFGSNWMYDWSSCKGIKRYI